MCVQSINIVKYLEDIKGYEVYDVCNDHVFAEDVENSELVLVYWHVNHNVRGHKAEDFMDRDECEFDAAEALSLNSDVITDDMPLRFDAVTMTVLEPGDRAFVRHAVNVDMASR